MGATISFNSEIRQQAALNQDEAVTAQPQLGSQYTYLEIDRALTQTTLPVPSTSESPALTRPEPPRSRREILQQILEALLKAMSSDEDDEDETLKAVCLYIINLIGLTGASGIEDATLPSFAFTPQAHTGPQVSPHHMEFKQLLQKVRGLLDKSKTAQHTKEGPNEQAFLQQLQTCLDKLEKASVAQATAQSSAPEQESLMEQVFLLFQKLMAQQNAKKTDPLILDIALDKTVSHYLDYSGNSISVNDETTRAAELAQPIANQEIINTGLGNALVALMVSG